MRAAARIASAVTSALRRRRARARRRPRLPLGRRRRGRADLRAARLPPHRHHVLRARAGRVTVVADTEAATPSGARRCSRSSARSRSRSRRSSCTRPTCSRRRRRSTAAPTPCRARAARVAGAAPLRPRAPGRQRYALLAGLLFAGRPDRLAPGDRRRRRRARPRCSATSRSCSCRSPPGPCLSEAPGRRILRALPLTLIGVAAHLGALEDGAYGAHPARGVVLGALTGLSYAGFILLLRHGTDDERRPAGPLFDATFVSAIACLAAALPARRRRPRPRLAVRRLARDARPQLAGARLDAHLELAAAAPGRRSRR